MESTDTHREMSQMHRCLRCMHIFTLFGKQYRGRWGQCCHARQSDFFAILGKLKNGKNLLFDQLLQLRTKEIGRKNGQYSFS